MSEPVDAHPHPPSQPGEDTGGSVRLTLKPDTARTGFVDGGWWPRSRDLRVELPGLLAAVGARHGMVERVAFALGMWHPTGRGRLVTGRFRVALDGFRSFDPDSVGLTTRTTAHDPITLVVIPPETPPAAALVVLRRAATVDNTDRPAELISGDQPTTGEQPPVPRHPISDPMSRLQQQAPAVTEGQDPPPVTKLPDPAPLAADASAARESRLARREQAIEAQFEFARESQDRLALEVHDNTIQRLFCLGLALDAMVTRQPHLAPQLSPLIDELDGTMRELRALIYGLARTSVTAATAHDAVSSLVRDSARALGFTPALGIHGDLTGAIDEHTAVDLLTVLREALSNIARHAQATSAWVRLTADTDTVSLRVSDDGTGPTPSAEQDEHDTADGHGIANMTARAVRHGGSLSIEPGQTGGTLVEWSIPVVPSHPSPIPEPGGGASSVRRTAT